MAIDDFLINSDYPLDQIVYMGSGSQVVAGGASPDILIAHGLPFRPMVIGTWSNSSTFDTSYDASVPIYGDFSLPYMNIQSTPTNIRLLPVNPTGGSLTFYWRAFGFMPPGIDLLAPYTASTADTFILNSDYNYSKLFSDGSVDISVSNQTITHNLGYRPQVEIWFEAAMDSNLLTRESFGALSTDTDINRIFITTTELQFVKGTIPGQQSIYYYRLYADSQT